MKSALKFLSLLFAVLIFNNIANAESPREQFKAMVAQLQQHPGDDALREQIIKLAQTLKPAPAIPEEAERRMVRGTAAFKGAKSVADYRDAAKEFEQATLAAPWYGDAYLNLGVTQDKAENYEAALRSLKFALLTSPNDKEIKALIYEVEYRNEKANSALALAEQAKTAEKEFTEKLDGAQWQQDKISYSHCADGYLEIHRGEIFLGWIVTRPNATGCHLNPKLGEGWYVAQGSVAGYEVVIDADWATQKGTISEDGEKIVLKFFPKPSHPSYPRESSTTYHRVKNPQWTVMKK